MPDSSDASDARDAAPPKVVEGTASWARRVLALFVDWVACTLVVILAVGPEAYYGGPDGSGSSVLVSSLPLLTYWAEASVLVALVGGSFGQLACRVRVVQLVGSGGRPLPLLPSLARHLLVLLVVPPLVFRPDGRGLHDLATGSAAMPLSWVRERSGG